MGRTKAMVDMVMDQRPLGLGHRAFDGVKLRGKVEAGPPLLDHGNHPAQMTFGTFQPLGDGGMA